MSSIFSCKYCDAIKYNVFQYTRLLKAFHENHSGFIVECTFDGCNSSYYKVNSFIKHVK